MHDKPIVLTLAFSNHEQAQHVLEAYHEAMGFGGSVGVTHPAHPAVIVDDVFTPDPTPEYNETPAAEVDERGVPYHPDFHSGSKKISKGAWNRRKGHDRAAADAYEASYLTAKSPHADTSGGLAGTQTTPYANAPAAPTVSAPEPTLQDFQNLWTRLCGEGKVFMTDQQHIERNWGGHPMSPTFYDPALRKQAYDYLMTCAYRQ
jgi:hypothetical protein